MGSFGELLGSPRWRKNSIVGMLLAFSGVVGLWGIGFFSFDLFRVVPAFRFFANRIHLHQHAHRLSPLLSESTDSISQPCAVQRVKQREAVESLHLVPLKVSDQVPAYRS